MTGTACNMHDNICPSFLWIYQPKERPDSMSSTEHGWVLVDDFVKWFDDHVDFFYPGGTIFVHESMIRWYCHEGD